MGKIVSEEAIKTNALAALLYISTAMISLLLNSSSLYFLPIWIPIGFLAGYIYFKGLTVLPGVFIASLLVHILFTFINIGAINPQIAIQTFSIVLSEIIALTIFNQFRVRWSLNDVSQSILVKALLFIFATILMPLPLLLAQGWYLFSLQITELNAASILSQYLFVANGFVLFIPLGLAWFNKRPEKLFNSIENIYLYLLQLVILSLLLIQHHFSSPWLGTNLFFYFLSFSLIIFISISSSYRLFTSTLSIFSITHLFLSYSSINDSNVFFSQPIDLVFLFVVVITSVFIKDKMSLETKTIISLKTNYTSIEDEINRQVQEYKSLNNRLFEEIEKRGIAERELAHSRKLLSEAQEVSRISTWEYSPSTKSFKWISNNNEVQLFDFNLENESLKSLAQKVHPDDLKKVMEWNKSLGSENSSFELEIRIKKKNDQYGYFLIRGKNICENKKTIRVLGLIMDITERKLSEQILLEKEEKFKALFDSNIDPVCVIDAQTAKIQDVNPAFVSVYGYSPDEIIGQVYTVLSAQPEETKSAIAFGRQVGNYRVIQRIHKKKNGSKFFIEANLMKHQVDGKDMLFIITHDITRRKESENSLAEREQKFRTFFESDLIGMAEISIAKEIISFNEKFSQILGFSPNELKLMAWDNLTYSEDIAIENRLFNQVLTHEIQGYSIEKRFVSKSSALVQCKVSLKAIKTSQGNISHLIILVDDITDRKRVESELIESRAKLSQAQSVAKLGSIRFFPGDNYISLSNEAYEILGFGSKRPMLTRKDLFALILPGSKGKFEEYVCDLENGKKVEGDYEQSILTSNGEVRYILVNFGLSTNSQNQVVEVLATLADITRIKQAEMALLEANTLKDQLFSIIGHDLRSPIGSMNQMIEMYVDRKTEFDENTSNSILQTLKNTSEETYKLLENLLEWAKSQRTDVYKPEVLNLVKITQEVLTLSKSIAESKNISLISNLPEKAIVMVDKEMIKTALRNLISNSIKFTPQAGMVMVSLTENFDSYIIAISDTGVGIEPNAIPKLFDNASSYTTTGTNNEKGSGLGLKLVKKFIEKNGGQINVESIVGQGSKFTFHLPKYSNTD